MEEFNKLHQIPIIKRKINYSILYNGQFIHEIKKKVYEDPLFQGFYIFSYSFSPKSLSLSLYIYIYIYIFCHSFYYIFFFNNK